MKFVPSTTTVADAIESAKSTAEELRGELQDWLDNLPENLQSSEKADALQEAIDALEEAESELEGDLPADVADLAVQYNAPGYSKSTYMSRAKRLEAGVAPLRGVVEALEKWADTCEDNDLIDEVQGVATYVEYALDSLDAVEFPTMR